MNRSLPKSADPMPGHPVYRYERQVEWGDCDPAGIVFYPRYLAMFDANTAGLFASVGLPIPELIRKHGIVGMPLVDVQAKFYRPSRFGDCITIESWIEEWGRAKVIVGHRILRDEQLAVQGREIRVWVASDPEQETRMQARPIPQEVIDRFR